MKLNRYFNVIDGIREKLAKLAPKLRLDDGTEVVLRFEDTQLIATVDGRELVFLIVEHREGD